MRATLETLSTKTQEFVYPGGAVGIAISRAILGNLVPRQVQTTGTYAGNANGRPGHGATRKNGRHEHVTT
jgi:hypothetical protein